MLGVSTMAGGLGMAVLAVTGNALVAAAAMASIGLANGPTDIALFSMRQRRTDPAWYGRAFAVSMSLNFAGMPLGSAVSGPLIPPGLTVAIGRRCRRVATRGSADAPADSENGWV